MKDGLTHHVLVSPFELYGILTDVNHAQVEERLEIRIGSAGKTEAYATLNIMTNAIGGIVWKKAGGAS